MRNSDKRLKDTDRDYELNLTRFANEISNSDIGQLITIINVYHNSSYDTHRQIVYSTFCFNYLLQTST